MFKRPVLKLMTFALVLAGGLSACDSATAPEQPVADRAMSYSWGSTPATTNSPSETASVTAVVGPAGGIVRNGDHQLWVPALAVAEPTAITFTMVGGNNVHADLSAVRVSDGAAVSNFPRALTLRLSYRNVTVSNPYRLSVAYLVDGTVDGELEKQASVVSIASQTVSAAVTHFSQYVMAID
ncbi:MAG TPA: hypothetical protein VK864_11310 [Longimicrobiales bacterium]|nr:hypothetical protein [Longimicrobiales bacterium]